MFDIKLVHVVAHASSERAEQARACFALETHAEVYASYDELIATAPDRGLIIAEDIVEWGGIAALLGGMMDGDFWLPVVATAVAPTPRHVVEAIKAGAIDYLPLPLDPARLSEALLRTGQEAAIRGQAQRQAVEARSRMGRLTQREREVLDLLVAGSSNKMIARDLQISPRTVEIHRAHMMSKLGAHHTADAVRMRLEAQMGTGFPAIIPPLAA